ncbi:hypothetical protein QE441_002755 [Chryseobacterium sp. SORGH_AS909]|uniref:Uncharacterized protein n=1 Tax=Chryseobacterium camelliae TaxID=1265445 RepID=A0ABU0TF34_9FLAO|nr:hypothetical protein [Chryseobacterium camelliae]MDQ1099613.1 hypothetical protein [Chryseobacterium sp. SORGH_AS_1048]MDR6086961.1 hypothetical protein [Chryseobacterium sp. SORGH_AS_0909]MDR6131333.1 hypothetical protein [Chryseobacterium sp. SORGH_AS_1175]MDT3406525.1 hypothetical protein [Pseudacidovorax intermedius]
MIIVVPDSHFVSSQTSINSSKPENLTCVISNNKIFQLFHYQNHIILCINIVDDKTVILE